jgi:hypothetical protein
MASKRLEILQSLSVLELTERTLRRRRFKNETHQVQSANTAAPDWSDYNRRVTLASRVYGFIKINLDIKRTEPLRQVLHYAVSDL